MYVHIDKPVTILLQVKRYVEISRRLNFFSDHINKALVKCFVQPALQPDINLEELERYIISEFFTAKQETSSLLISSSMLVTYLEAGGLKQLAPTLSLIFDSE
jgi:hypothetical protein